MAPKQSAKKHAKVADTAAMEAKLMSLASSIIDVNCMSIQLRIKSQLNKVVKKEACTWRDPRLGLILLQIAVIADNVPAGASRSLSLHLQQVHSEHMCLIDLGRRHRPVVLKRLYPSMARVLLHV